MWRHVYNGGIEANITRQHKGKTMTSEQAERFEASLRATHARIDRRLNTVHEKLDKEEAYSLPDTVFGKLLGQRDELANASNDLELLRSEFELFKQGVL